MNFKEATMEIVKLKHLKENSKNIFSDAWKDGLYEKCDSTLQDIIRIDRKIKDIENSELVSKDNEITTKTTIL